MSVSVPILLYHSVSNDATPHYRPFAISPELFAAHVAYLRENGYTPITVSRFVTAMADPASLPDRPVVLTFDDGLADFYTGAFPVLLGSGFPATLYVTAGFVGGTSGWLRRQGEDRRPMLTWRQLLEVSENGIECGAHSLTHPQLDTLSAARAAGEIGQSKAILEQNLGRAVATFAYPYGYHSASLRRLVEMAGFTSACAVKHAMSSTEDDCFALARIVVSATTSVAALATLLSRGKLPVAPVGERVATRVWRLLRRLAARAGRRDDLPAARSLLARQG